MFGSVGWPTEPNSRRGRTSVRVRLKYHKATCELLRVKPVAPPARLAALEERERACATTFPPSVREWFSLENAEALFDQHGGGYGRLVPLGELGNPADVARGYLKVVAGERYRRDWYAR